MTDEARSEWNRAILHVGTGRGTVVETGRGERFVITAARCLPHLPPHQAASGTWSRTYPRLIGKLDTEPTVSAECLFADSVADLAVLGPPNIQALHDEAGHYKSLLETAELLPLGGLAYERELLTLPDGFVMSGQPHAESAAWVLSLEGQWLSCRVQSRGTTLWFKDLAAPIHSGMSGLPIVGPKGEAIGILSTGIGPHLRLADCLPVWLLRALAPDLLTPVLY